MIVVGGRMNGSHVVWVMMNDLAQRENVPDLVVFSANTLNEKHLLNYMGILIFEHWLWF